MILKSLKKKSKESCDTSKESCDTSKQEVRHEESTGTEDTKESCDASKESCDTSKESCDTSKQEVRHEESTGTEDTKEDKPTEPPTKKRKPNRWIVHYSQWCKDHPEECKKTKVTERVALARKSYTPSKKTE